MSEMIIEALINPIVDESLFKSRGSSAGKSYADSFNNAFSKTKPLGRITGSVSEFEKSMEAANARVIAFGASAGGIYLIASAFKKLISDTINVEKNLAS